MAALAVVDVEEFTLFACADYFIDQINGPDCVACFLYESVHL